jgi:glc operon protein GlcG
MSDFVATHRITHEACLKMINAGVAKANALGAPVSLAVVDASGVLLAFLRMDGARFFSGRATIKKAITSASQRLPSGYFPKEGEVSMQIRMDGEFTNIAGGFPITVEGQVIGGVGAGGAKVEQDVEIAKAALDALKL